MPRAALPHGAPTSSRHSLFTHWPPPRQHRHRYHGVLAPNAPPGAAAIAFGRETEVSSPPRAPTSNARSPAHSLWALLP